MGLLQVFAIHVYALFDSNATIYFVITLLAWKFDVLLDIFIESFSVCIPMGYSIVAKRVYRKFPIMLPNKVTLVDFVELDIFDFDIILGMGWLHHFFLP